MKARSRVVGVWLALLVAGSMAAAGPARAQTYDRNRAPAPPRVEFRYRPQWMTVSGTNVLMIREDQRPAYDMFSYGSQYYIYDNGYWYQADSWSGPFSWIDDRDVPVAIHRVPESEWQTYPSGWVTTTTTTRNNGYYDNNGYWHGNNDNSNNGYVTYDVSNAPAPPPIYYRHNPRWVTVPGTRVMMVRDRDRPDYDLFSVGSTYYIYDNGYWYRSNRWSGPFVAMDMRSVPTELSGVPRQYWRSYPTTWTNRSYNSGYQYRYRRTHRVRN